MELTQPKIQIIERIITTEKGVFLARFAVTEIGGKFKAKLTDMRPFQKEEAQVSGSKIPCLEAPQTKDETNYTEPLAQLIESPFYVLDFFMSQPTRAPNFSLSK